MERNKLILPIASMMVTSVAAAIGFVEAIVHHRWLLAIGLALGGATSILILIELWTTSRRHQ